MPLFLNHSKIKILEKLGFTPIFKDFILIIICRRPESNRYGRLVPQDFKSCASASSATPANIYNKTTTVNRGFLLLATRKGFEPSTSAVTGRRSNQLSHRALQIRSFHAMESPHYIQWTFRDSNPGPIGYEPIALTS